MGIAFIHYIDDNTGDVSGTSGDEVLSEGILLSLRGLL